MRIAIVHPYPAKAGMEETTSAIIVRDRALGALIAADGHEVRGFKATEGSRCTVSSPDPFLDWSYFPLDLDRGSRPASEVYSSELVDAVRSWSPDVLFVKGYGAAMGRELMSEHEGPVVVILGGSHKGPALARADLVLTENEDQEDFLRWRVGERRLIRLPKLPSAEFSPVPGEPPVFDVAVVGKFEPHKNHAAVAPLFESDLRIVMIGEGSLRGSLQRLARDGVARVEFPGFVGVRDVARFVRTSRILVHPSLSEGFPRAVVEAMAAGTPSVCIKGVVGWPLEHGVNGLLVSEQELVPKTLELLADDATLRKLADRALETAQREFSMPALERTVTRIVDRLSPIESGVGRPRLRHAVRHARFRLADLPRRLLRGPGRRIGELLAHWRRGHVRNGARTIRVMGSSAYGNNSFVPLMNEALEGTGRVELRPYSILLAMRPWAEVWQFNWPERSYRSPALLVSTLRAAKLLLQMNWARLVGTRTAWTVHNLTPHESPHPLIEAWFWPLFRRSVDIFVHLSMSGGSLFIERFPETRRRSHVYLRHPAYPLPEDLERDRVRARDLLGWDAQAPTLIAPGLMRPYKNLPESIQAFSKVAIPEVRLIVAGKPINEAIRREVEQAAADDARVSVEFGFLDEERFRMLLVASDYVLLPYDDFLNSGLLLLSLSLGRPVIVPETPVTSEIGLDVGPGWLHLFRGDLNAVTLESVIANPERPSSEPDLSKYTWQSFAEELADAFEAVLGRAPMRRDG